MRRREWPLTAVPAVTVNKHDGGVVVAPLRRPRVQSSVEPCWTRHFQIPRPEFKKEPVRMDAL